MFFISENVTVRFFSTLIVVPEFIDDTNGQTCQKPDINPIKRVNRYKTYRKKLQQNIVVIDQILL